MIHITMPRLSDTMEEGSILAWHKKPGDSVNVGDVLVEIETDKATMEYEAYEAGVLSKIIAPEGELVSIGSPIAELEDGNGDASITADSSGPAAAAPDTIVGAPTGPGSERRFASPLVRKIAREQSLDLSEIKGTGPGGRIIRADIDPLLQAGAALGGVAEQRTPSAEGPAIAGSGRPDQTRSLGPAADKRDSEAVPLSQVRRVIARRLGESVGSIPHFYVTASADAEGLLTLRADVNAKLEAAGRPKVSINDLLIRASALALREHPLINASYVDDQSATMLVHRRVNVGIAVASENGLVVPVIADTDQKTVTQLGAEARELVGLANAKKLTAERMSGGTFTVSNLGMFGVEQFTAIINPPQGAILAVGGTKPEAVVVDGDVVAHNVIRYTLSADHRIIDGALAAQFLQTLSRLIENPLTIIA